MKTSSALRSDGEERHGGRCACCSVMQERLQAACENLASSVRGRDSASFTALDLPTVGSARVRIHAERRGAS